MTEARTRTRQEAVAIIGMGCIFPGASSLEVFWDNICSGVDAVSDVPPGRWDPVFYDPGPAESDRFPAGDRFYCRRGGFVDELASFDPTVFGIMPVTVAGGEPDQFLALGQAAAALADCDDPQERTPSDRVGVVVGRGSYQTPGIARLAQRVSTAQQLLEALRALLPDVDDGRLQQVRDEFVQQLGPDRPEAAIGLVPNLAASRIANRYDLQGPAYTVDAACASALVAVDHGVRDLTGRRCDLVLAGGVHHCHDVTLWSVFTQLGALSRTSQIRPFSRHADGTVVGEGSGFFVLKRLADAERDGDRIYAVVRGTGVASDGRARSLMTPDTTGQVLAMERAWAAAGLDPATVGLVEAHGAGTPLGDEVELEGLRQVFGKADDDATRAGLGSVKSMIGHAMPAAGAAGLIKTALALHEGIRPPTLHAEEPHPLLSDTRFRLVHEAEPWTLPESRPPATRRAAVSAFGFGGINAHIVLEEHAPRLQGGGVRDKASGTNGRLGGQPRRTPVLLPAASEAVPLPPTLLLAGEDAGDVARQLQERSPAGSALDDPVSVSVSEGSPASGPTRLAVIDPSPRRLELARRVVEQSKPWRGRDGVWFEPRGLLLDGGRLALLFPGVEPTFEPRVEDVARLFDLQGLVDPILQATALDDSVNGSGLHRRARGIIAVGRLFHRVFQKLGVEADMVAGHSLGEWTAELAAGVIAEAEFEALVDQLAPGSVQTADLGFLAAGCGIDRARELAAGLRDTTVSHDNCPHQTVLCGPSKELEVVAERCRERQILAQELPFRSGFHSPLFSDHLPAVDQTLGSLSMRAPTVPLWSATTCQPYPDDPDDIRQLAARHLVEPVRFRELLLALHAAEARVFVQMGPGGLCGFVDDTLRSCDAVALAANSPRHTGLHQLHTVSTALWVQGKPLALERLAQHAHDVQDKARVRPPQREGAVPLDLGTRLVRELTPLHDARPNRPPRKPQTTAEALVSERVFSLVDEPAWADHALVRQAAGWPDPEDRFPLVPMTGIVEVLMAAARELQPGWVPVAVEDIAAFRWLTVEPPTTATIRAAHEADEGNTVRVKVAIDGHARATVVMAPGYPRPPGAPDVLLSNERPSPVSAADFYGDRHMFHGPAYQGVSDLVSVADDGSRARLTSLRAPGALLDAAGQLMGHWLATSDDPPSEALPPERTAPQTGNRSDRLVLPTAIERIELFGPSPTPGTELDCTLLVTHDDPPVLRCNLTLSLGGRLWCRVTGWQDRCFPTDEAMFRTFRWPERSSMSTSMADGVALTRDRWADSPTRDLVMRRYLGRDERAQYERLNPLAQRKFLLGRIAVKDAVRDWVWSRQPDAAIFPAEVVVAEDPSGRPLVEGAFQERLLADLQVSLSYVDDLAAAVASEAGTRTVGPGIDVERIEPRRSNFEDLALTRLERDLRPPEGFDRDTWLTCLWAVKEAAAEATGHGLRGRPKDIEVLEHADGVARVGSHRIAFRKLAPGTDPSPRSPNQKEHVVAWTITE